jgi:hypothetical protein
VPCPTEVDYSLAHRDIRRSKEMLPRLRVSYLRWLRPPLARNVALASCNLLISKVVKASFWQGNGVLASCNLLIYRAVKAGSSFVLGFVRHKRRSAMPRPTSHGPLAAGETQNPERCKLTAAYCLPSRAAAVASVNRFLVGRGLFFQPSISSRRRFRPAAVSR